MTLSERDRSIASYMPLMDRVVANECRKLTADEVLKDDIRSFALEGLALALDEYDANRGATFKYFAEKKMRWSIYDNLRRFGPLPKSIHRRLKFLTAAQEMLAEEAKAPSPKTAKEAIHRLAGSMTGLASAFVVTCSAETMDAIASVPPDAETSLVRKQTSATLLAYIDTLPEKERKVLIDYFYRGKSLVDIAGELNVTKSWISKIMAKGLSSIRSIVHDNPELLTVLKDP